MIPTKQGFVRITEKVEYRELRLTLRADEHDRLVELARARGATVQDVIRRFAQTCQPTPDVPGRSKASGQ